MQYFNIQVASQLSGVATATIRAWEKRYRAVCPERADNKHRLYSEKDIEKLAILFKLTELGQSIGKIAHLEMEELKHIFSTLTHKNYEDFAPTPASLTNPDELRASFFLALSAYKLDILSHELEKAVLTLGPRELCLDILIPLFHEIGHKVLKGEITTSQEHTLSALTRFYLGQIIGRHYQKTFKQKDLILIATPEGELHEVGILGAALLCIHHGIKFVFLSANLPAESLAQTANALKPKAILLGTTRYELTPKMNLEDYLSAFQRDLKIKSKVLVGGNLKPTQRQWLEKNKIEFFPSLDALDLFLGKTY